MYTGIDWSIDTKVLYKYMLEVYLDNYTDYSYKGFLLFIDTIPEYWEGELTQYIFGSLYGVFVSFNDENVCHHLIEQVKKELSDSEKIELYNDFIGN
jgi:ABC-type dipeptide/oligopeptide/nickel transport system permease component